MKKLLPIIFILLVAGQAWGAAEVFYACSGGDGTLPESQVCATAWDLADVRSPANWTSIDADDGLIGPTEDILLLDTNDDPIKVGGRGFDFLPRIGPPFRPTIKWVDYTTLYDLFVYLHFTEDLSDSQGELADGTFARASASTYIDPDTGYLTMAHADRVQFIEDDPDFSMQNPVTGDSWWTLENCTLGATGGIIADSTDNEIKRIGRSDTGWLPVALDYPLTTTFSFKAKSGSLSWARYVSYNSIDGLVSVYFNLDSGVVGTGAGTGFVSSSISSIDSDGYYRCWATVTVSKQTEGWLYVAESGSDYTITASDTVTPLIYVKEIQLEEVPSDLALGPDLTVVGITSANPGVVTITGHGLLTGDYVQFKSLTEMTELNGTTQKIIKLGADTFSIINTSTYAAETTGGSCANKIPASAMHDGSFNILPSDYINASSIPAEPRFEADGLAFLGTSVLNLLPYWDFTEWVASNVTVTQDATGPDGVAGTAYTLLATAGNGTVKYTPVAATDTDYYFTPWLKRKTGTGNVDITVDDGTTWTTKTLTTAWQRFAVTKSAANPVVGIRLVTDTDAVYAYGPTLTQTSYFCGVDIPSNGAPTAIAAESLLTANTANLLNVVDIAEGDATSEGTLTTEITFGFSYTDLSGDVALISLNDGTAFLYCDNAGNIEATDGTNTVNVDIDFAAGDTITVVLTWSATGDSIRMGILESSSWTWDADSAAYDDDWTNGTNLNIGFNTAFPFHIKDTKFYSRALSPIVIDATYVAGMYTTTDGDYYVTADGDYYLPAN